MAGLPKVTILFSDGNLLRDIAAIDGIGGIIGTVESPALIGVHKIVYNLKDAVSKGYTEADEPFMYRQLSEFYAEIAGNQELHVMGVENTMTMTQMLDKDDENGAAKLLLSAQNRIRLLAVCRKPDGGYDPGNAFYDGDVSSALTKSIAFGQDQNAKYNYLRFLIEGRVVNENSVDILTPTEINTPYAGLVVGGSANDGSASVGTMLGRAVKYAAHIKVGKVFNGPLQLTEAYIGTKKISEYFALDALHESGVISFMKHPTKAGIYPGIDRMATTGDYRLLAYGRLIDKAAIIALGTYVDYIEDEVDTTEGGKLEQLEAMHLEGAIKQQILSAMGDQISANGVEVYINPDQVIIPGSKLIIRVRIRPKGYLSFITVDLGLTA